MGGETSKSESEFDLINLLDLHLGFFKRIGPFLDSLDAPTLEKKDPFDPNPWIITPGPAWLVEGLKRYKAFLRLRSQGDQRRDPPPDVAWIWHLHLLQPGIYQKMCRLRMGHVFGPRPGELSSPRESTMQELDQTIVGLLESGRVENLHMDFPRVHGIPEGRDGEVATLEVIHRKQLEFFRKMRNFEPHPTQKRAIALNFLRFLEIQKDRNDMRVTLAPEIELLWHAVMHNPKFYARICEKVAWKFVDHSDLLEDAQVDPTNQKNQAIFVRSNESSTSITMIPGPIFLPSSETSLMTVLEAGSSGQLHHHQSGWEFLSFLWICPNFHSHPGGGLDFGHCHHVDVGSFHGHDCSTMDCSSVDCSTVNFDCVC